MIDKHYNPQHFIQRFILDTLRHQQFARFRDLRPEGVDSNAFSYHLTQLIKQGLVDKLAEGYTLSVQGLAYIDRVSSLDTRPRRQPKIMTITAIINESDEILVRRKATQPMINQITLPCGMLHMDDLTAKNAALREVKEKMMIEIQDVTHIGDCYMAVRHDGVVIMNTLMHVFIAYVKKDEITLNDSIFWHDQNDIDAAAPATRKIIKTLQTESTGGRFFKEYVEDL